ncbi:MAG: chemotaxis protein CheA [Limisphaerales bacterium]
MNTQNAAQTFLQEADDLLERIEETALGVNGGDSQTDDAVNQLFRAFHTIKGSGAMFGFDRIAAFTHHVETVLDLVRDRRLALTEELIKLILLSKDHIDSLLNAERTGASVPAESGDKLTAALNALLPPATPAAAVKEAAKDPEKGAPPVATAGTPQTFQIHFRPNPALMVAGGSPLALLDELRCLGECVAVASPSAIPPLEQLQPDQCYFSWDITLTTDKGLNAVKDVFIFVEDGSEISIKPVPPAGAKADLPSGERDLPRGRSAMPEKKPAAPPSGASSPPLRKPTSQEATVRVPAERLDRLVNLVGEFVMNQSRLMQVAATANVPNLNGPAEELARLVDELRDNVLGIRMMPIGSTFSRFKRLVHDLSAELGKEIDLVAEGAETELDKTVLDQLGDPLVHVIRNCIDHGIELPDDRVHLGKPRRGVVRLTATHVGSNVVIAITDDGRGIDTDAVRAKAVEKKLIAPESNLSQREILDLIFLPGFSTAKKVTNVSGRGVGMDVVKRQIDALRGRVAITSEAGRGATLTLTLPLTLAIIDGLLVEIGRDQFIVPMSVVTENVELHRAERGSKNGRNVVAVRGDLVPYIRLREAFAINGLEPDVEKIVIARQGDDRVGMVVDRVLGNHQTVIQSLGKFNRNVELVSGATIMGDGRVALILDLAGLIRFANEQARRAGQAGPIETNPESPGHRAPQPMIAHASAPN